MHPPPPLHALSPPCAEESIDLSMLEHATFPGECSNVGRFFYFALLTAQHCANHNARWCVSASSSRIALPHLQSCRETASLGETCSRHPSHKRLRVGLLLLAAPTTCAQANHQPFFSTKKYLNAPLPPHPLPLQFYHPPPSPGAPLNNIQRVRLWSRADIEGGTGGFKVINIIRL